MLLTTLLTASASPAATVDQDTGLAPNGDGGFGIVTVQDVGQSVTVGITGTLTQVDIQLFRQAGAEGDVTFRVVPLADGLPDESTVLFTSVIPWDGIPLFEEGSPTTQPWTSVDISPGGIELESGTQFAFTLTRFGLAQPPWVGARANFGVYSGGDALENCCTPVSAWGTAGDDLRFRTWMAPEPSRIVLGGSAVAALASLRRARPWQRPRRGLRRSC